MAGLIPLRKQRRAERKAGMPAPAGEFPFFLSQMRDEFDQMFERLSHEWPGLREATGNGWRWEVDVRDEADAVRVRAEAPGFEPGDFDLQVTDNRLVLRASKQSETKDKEGKVRERQERECYHSVLLPPGVHKEKVEARYHNGVLTVTLPKTAEGKGRRVPIKGD